MGGQPHQTNPFSKRARENSGEYEDLEDDESDAIFYALVGALNNRRLCLYLSNVSVRQKFLFTPLFPS